MAAPAPATPPAQAEPASQAAAQESPEPPRESWSFAGPFGTFDRAQLQRGYRVYKEVCSNCHSMKLVQFRNLSDPGGPGFSEAQVKALAATYSFPRESSQGTAPHASLQCTEASPPPATPLCRPGRPSDTFPLPDPAALAALGAVPPDMSVLAKARTYERGFPLFIVDAVTQYQEEGPDYIVALLQGYREPPAGVTLSGAQSYNVYFPGHKIGMPPPLTDGQIDYTDGSPKTVKQYAADAAAFLSWAAEPKLEDRKSLGLRVMIFLIVFAFLLYLCKNRIWAAAHTDDEKA